MFWSLEHKKIDAEFAVAMEIRAYWENQLTQRIIEDMVRKLRHNPRHCVNPGTYKGWVAAKMAAILDDVIGPQQTLNP